MKKGSLVLSTGLAMFSMFFGSGNLVFPIVVGQMSHGHFGWASFGILLTGVLVPFLGILAMLLFKGDTKDFFGRLGKPAVFWFPLIALSLMGPFGVLARCITVSYGAFKLILPHIPLWTFSIAMCLVIFLLTVRKNKIVTILGTSLTPFLLLSLAIIVFCALQQYPLPVLSNEGSAWESFKVGIFQGYQTMDLLAAFFFSTFVIMHLQKEKDSLPIFFQSSTLGAGLLAIIYVFLVLLGAMFATPLATIQPEEMLGFIAQESLGRFAVPLVCTAVILACITTAIVLASLFADFLRKEITKDKMSNSIALSITLCIAFFTSTLEFSGIAKILGPILEVIYPALIVLTILNIFHKLWGWTQVRMPIFAAFVLKLLSNMS